MRISRRPGPEPVILLAPTAFKATLSVSRVLAAMTAGARTACPHAQLHELPLSDGGPGLIEALQLGLGGRSEVVAVRDPLGRPATGRILELEISGQRVAVVESADACGLHLLTDAERDPLRASSAGVGDLLLAASALADTVVLGLGGSGTMDGGAGMASALGWRLLDEESAPIPPGAAGLARLARMVPPSTGLRARVVALADVANPLLGPRGAASVFGPQKGATPENIPILEAALGRLAGVIASDLSTDVERLTGGGAAGGLGAAAVAFLNADLPEGSDWVLRAVGFDPELASADLVITGEGSWDEQSTMGKITGEVVERARRAGVPVLLVAGRVTGEVPRHVTAAAAPAGAILDADDVRRMVAREVARMAPSLGC
ncbi:MAG TPA: glycerate kinase [Longimicrobiales bacterium]|nr:glycerate kinase [Longimicrobiales bacterium]